MVRDMVYVDRAPFTKLLKDIDAAASVLAVVTCTKTPDVAVSIMLPLESKVETVKDWYLFVEGGLIIEPIEKLKVPGLNVPD